MKTWLVKSSLVWVAMLAIACTASDDGHAVDGGSTDTATRGGETVTTAIGLDNEFEIAYVVAGAFPGEEHKTFVWRQSNRERRWDFMWMRADGRESGITFVQAGFPNESSSRFSDLSIACEWQVIAPGSREAEAECYDGPPPLLRGIFQVLDLPLRETGERQSYAGREGECFEMSGTRGEEGAVCLDAGGLPLMFAGREASGAELQVIDAFAIRDTGSIHDLVPSPATLNDLRARSLVTLDALLVPLDYLPERVD